MLTVFAIHRAPIGLTGWRKDNMPPGTWTMMPKTDGSFGPEVLISCPKCYADIMLNGEQAYGKKAVSHGSRIIFDPRQGQGNKTIMCGAQFYFRKNQNCLEIVT